jgi:hypothetical protein
MVSCNLIFYHYPQLHINIGKKLSFYDTPTLCFRRLFLVLKYENQQACCPHAASNAKAPKLNTLILVIAFPMMES